MLCQQHIRRKMYLMLQSHMHHQCSGNNSNLFWHLHICCESTIRVHIHVYQHISMNFQDFEGNTPYFVWKVSVHMKITKNNPFNKWQQYIQFKWIPRPAVFMAVWTLSDISPRWSASHIVEYIRVWSGIDTWFTRNSSRLSGKMVFKGIMTRCLTRKIFGFN